MKSMETKSLQNGESRIRKILFSEAAMVATIIVVAVSVIQFFNNPSAENTRRIIQLEAQVDSFQKITDQINNLRDNHIHTLEVRLEDQSKTIEETQREVIEIKTILNERLPAKR